MFAEASEQGAEAVSLSGTPPLPVTIGIHTEGRERGNLACTPTARSCSYPLLETATCRSHSYCFGRVDAAQLQICWGWKIKEWKAEDWGRGEEVGVSWLVSTFSASHVSARRDRRVSSSLESKPPRAPSPCAYVGNLSRWAWVVPLAFLTVCRVAALGSYCW